MANDPISAALVKGEAKYQQLQAKTMPFYDKMQQGKFSKADMKKLKSLYLEQSKTAAAAFEESSKAVEKNAKLASRSIVSKAVSDKQLLNAKELHVIMNSAFSKAFQKSADQIKQAVDESLQGQLDSIKEILTAIQATILSDQEVIAHIREQLLPSFASLAQIENPDFETLLDPRVRRRFLKAREKTLADEIVTRTVKAIIGYDKLKEQEKSGQFKKRTTKWYNPLSKITGTVQSLKDLYKRQQFERQYGKLNAVNELDDVYKSIDSKQTGLKKFINQVSSLKQFTQSVLFNLSQYDLDKGQIRSDRFRNQRLRHAFAGERDYGYSIQNTPSSIVSRVAAFYAYPVKKVKDSKLGQIIKEKIDEKLPRREKFSIEETSRSLIKFLKLDRWTQTLDLLKKNFLYHISPLYNTKDSYYEIAKEKFVERIKEKYKETPQKVDQFLDRLEDIERNRYNTPQAERAFIKMRSLIMKDVRSQWFVNIKHTANRYYQAAKKRLTKSQAFSRAKKIFKTVGYLYLASLIINTLSAVFPNWKENVISAIGEALEFGATKAVPVLLGAIPAIILATGKFIIDNIDTIAAIAVKVVAAIGSTIIDAFLNLFYSDKMKSVPDKFEDREKADRQKFLDTEAAQKIMQQYNISRTYANTYLSGNQDFINRLFYDEDGNLKLTQEQMDGLEKLKALSGGLGNNNQNRTLVEKAKDTVSEGLSNLAQTAVKKSEGTVLEPIAKRGVELVSAKPMTSENDSQKAAESTLTNKLANTTATATVEPTHDVQPTNVVGTSNTGKNSGTTSSTNLDTSKSSSDLEVINGGLLFNDA